MSEAKRQANEPPKPVMTPSTNPSWVKLTTRIAQNELQLKGGNLTPAQQVQFESQLERDRIKLLEVETAIVNANTAPTTSSQDRREGELNRREGQLRAAENALVDRTNALIKRAEGLNDREADIIRREESVTSREQHHRERLEQGREEALKLYVPPEVAAVRQEQAKQLSDSIDQKVLADAVASVTQDDDASSIL